MNNTFSHAVMAVLFGLLAASTLRFLTPDSAYAYPAPKCPTCDCRDVSLMWSTNNDFYNNIRAAYYYKDSTGSNKNYGYAKILTPNDCTPGAPKTQQDDGGNDIMVKRWYVINGTTDLCAVQIGPPIEVGAGDMGYDSNKSDPWQLCKQ
jgi:hypothetical protein